MMRILVAADQWFPDFKGGSARVAAETAGGLAELGHDVTVLVPQREGAPSRERAGNLTVLRLMRRHGIPQTFADVAAAAWHARRLRGTGFDVALAHEATVAVGLGAVLETPIALVYHASALRELRFLRGRTTSRPRRATLAALTPPVAALERRAVARASSILTLSGFTDSLVAVDHPSAMRKVMRVSGGVDTTWFSPGDGQAAARRRLGLEAGPLSVAVRRLEPRMGLDVLLQALPLLRASDHRLALVGDGMLRSALEQQARDLGISNRVLFAGAVSEEDLRDWYRAADVVVVPTVAYEGFGLATVEALACSSPVVGTAVGATPELLGPLDPRLIAAEATPAGLAEALERVTAFTGPAFRAACREYAASYSWPHVIPGWEAALAAVPGRGHASEPENGALAEMPALLAQNDRGPRDA
jgi:glycosyltransferase involved in cell wall biosynthesis